MREPQLLDHLFGRGLFLHLFGDEPLQDVVRAVVFELQRQVGEIVDEARDRLLVLQRVLEHGQRARPLGLRLCDGLERHRATTFEHVVEELHGVRRLLLELHVHPAGTTAQAQGGEPSRHGEIQIGRVELGVDLLVERCLHLLVKHGRLLWLVASRGQLRLCPQARAAQTPAPGAT